MGYSTTPQALFVGKMQRDFFITTDDQIYLDVLGGNLVYAAVGYKLWIDTPPPGLLARIGEDYPQEWLDVCRKHGLDTRGIKILPQALDLRAFSAPQGDIRRVAADPVTHFARLGMQLPKPLLGYRMKSKPMDSKIERTPCSIRQGDIPDEYHDATIAHLCPLDFLTHGLLPAVFRQEGFSMITLDPSPGYMNPAFFSDYPSIVTGLTAFLPSEEDMRNLFAGKTEDLHKMAETVASYGCKIVVIKRGVRGQLLFDAEAGQFWEIPAYPARVKDLTGAGDAFCGGFLAGLRNAFDPLEAVLHGNISASLVCEGSGVFFALDALPGLAEARLNALRQSVIKL